MVHEGFVFHKWALRQGWTAPGLSVCHRLRHGPCQWAHSIIQKRHTSTWSITEDRLLGKEGGLFTLWCLEPAIETRTWTLVSRESPQTRDAGGNSLSSRWRALSDMGRCHQSQRGLDLKCPFKSLCSQKVVDRSKEKSFKITFEKPKNNKTQNSLVFST